MVPEQSLGLGVFVFASLWAHFPAIQTSYQVMEWNNTPSHPMGADRHPCDRVCVEGEAPMTCKYKFTVEVYSSLGRVSSIFMFIHFIMMFLHK
jgi:hypothetical protein